MKDDLARFSKLTLSDDDELMFPIDIATLEPNSFADTHASCREQAQEGLVRSLAKPASGHTRLKLSCSTK